MSEARCAERRYLLDPRWWTLGLVLIWGMGCATITSEEFDALQRLSIAMAEARRDYKLLPGDTVRIVIYRGAQVAPDYRQDITVQPDGLITLINVDQAVTAAGRTVPELTEIIRKVYEPVFQKEPDRGSRSQFSVTVQFLTSAKNAWLPDQVFVVGEVNRSLAIPYRRGLTVVQAIAQAGGWKYTANESRVVVMRLDQEGTTVTREVDVSAVVSHVGDDMELFPGDVVFVPLSIIARLNLIVQFYIRGMLPFNPSTIRTFLVF